MCGWVRGWRRWRYASVWIRIHMYRSHLTVSAAPQAAWPCPCQLPADFREVLRPSSFASWLLAATTSITAYHYQHIFVWEQKSRPFRMLIARISIGVRPRELARMRQGMAKWDRGFRLFSLVWSVCVWPH